MLVILTCRTVLCSPPAAPNRTGERELAVLLAAELALRAGSLDGLRCEETARRSLDDCTGRLARGLAGAVAVALCPPGQRAARVEPEVSLVELVGGREPPVVRVVRQRLVVHDLRCLRRQPLAHVERLEVRPAATPVLVVGEVAICTTKVRVQVAVAQAAPVLLHVGVEDDAVRASLLLLRYGGGTSH